jgi:hypothetical protein
MLTIRPVLYILQTANSNGISLILTKTVFSKGLEPPPEPLVVRLSPAGAPPLAAQLNGRATVCGATLSRPTPARGRGDRRHGRRRVCLRSGGLAHHNVPGGHRGKEHVARMHCQGELN